MSSKKYDCIVIGGGPSAVHTAYPLVEMGLEVLMLDGGVESTEDIDIPQSFSFESIRREMYNQHEVFLGKDLSGAIPADKTNQSSHMSSGRFSYIGKYSDEHLPVETKGFHFNQTLAKGGMTEIWGGASDVLDSDELKAIGLPDEEMKENYQILIDRIGVSGSLKNYKTQNPANISTHSKKLLDRFNKNKVYFNKLGIDVHPSTLALLTENKDDRKGTSYSDTDYWDNNGKSLYRARFTLEELEKKNNFHYVSGKVVMTLSESNKGITVSVIDFLSNKHEFEAGYVIVASGTINTVRILLRSFSLYDKKVKITSKPHVITPCIDLGFLGNTEDPKKHSLCQLVLEDTKKINGFNKSYSQIYTYKSLLLFKLLEFLPLTRPESLGLLSLFVPSMILVDSRFPSSINENKTCELRRGDNGDVLSIGYEVSSEELTITKRQMKIIKKSLRKLGLMPLKQVYMPEGSTAHYAGGIVVGSDDSFPLHANINGMIKGSSRIFVSDASLWKALPPKPPTLTIMANANRIGLHVAKLIKSNR